MIYSIYGLIDSRDNKLFYVGISNNAQLRKQQHQMTAKKNDHSNAKRIQEIRGSGGKVVMMLIELVDGIEATRDREWFWISCYRAAGYELTNTHKMNREFDQSPDEAINAFPLIPLLTLRQYKALHKVLNKQQFGIETDTKKQLAEKGLVTVDKFWTLYITPYGIVTMERYGIYESFIFAT